MSSSAITDPILTPDQLVAIARRAYGPRAVLAEAVPVGGGTVNEVWRLGIAGEPDAILRVAPSPEAAASGPSWLTADGLRREGAAIALLPHLAPILPRSIRFDGSREIVDRVWVVQSIVPGRPWSEVDAALDDEGRIGLWRQLGAICRAIHAVIGPAFGLAQSPGVATWADLLQDDACGLLNDAVRFGIDREPFARLLAAVVADREVLNRVTVPSLIHSDLGPRHCFVEPDADDVWRIVGLIDLEFARFADPLSESVIVAFGLVPPDQRFRDAFWEGYGAFGSLPGAERRAMLYAAIALGWVATDLGRLGDGDQVEPILAQMADALGGLGGTPA